MLCYHRLCTFVRPFVRPSVRTPRNAIGDKRMNLESANFDKVRMSFSIQSVNVLDLYFQGQRFESSTLKNCEIISQMATDVTKLLLGINKKLHTAVRWEYQHLTLPLSNGRGQSQPHFSTVTILQTVKDRTNVTTAIKFEVAYMRF